MSRSTRNVFDSARGRLSWFSIGAAILLGALPAVARAQVGTSLIIPETTARRHGMTRAWVARVEIDAGRSRVIEVTLHEDALIAVTNGATVHSFDAETGRTHWTSKVGRAGHPITPVGASEKFVAVCNASSLYVLDRATGKIIITRSLEGAPSAAPAVSNEFAYVPTFGGGIEAYSLDLKHERKIPAIYRGKGSIDEAPILTAEHLIWPTHAGCVYCVAKEDLQARFRFLTRGEITAGLGYAAPLIYAASADGFVYAINEKNGSRAWQFSTGYPARETPVALDGRVYAISELSGLYCLTADKGDLAWFTHNVHKWVAASPTRLYAADVVGRLKVLDRASGGLLETLPTERLPIKVHNIQNDRLYLCTTDGLIQCFHEIELDKPHVHAVPVAPKPGAATPATPEKKAPVEAPAEEPAADMPAEPDAVDPFGNPLAP